MTSVADTNRISQAPPSPLREFWHYFRENSGAVAGLAVVLGLIFLAVFADLIAPHSPFEQYRDALEADLAYRIWLRRGLIVALFVAAGALGISAFFSVAGSDP